MINGDNIDNKDDFTQDEEYKLNNMDKQDSKDSVDSGSLPNINRLKSQTYWTRRNIYHTQLNSTRHQLGQSRKYIEQGRVANMAKIFNTPIPDSQPSLAALSNLPEQPAELIRDLSHKTKTQITSTRLKRTNGPRHKNVRSIQIDTDAPPTHDPQQ